MKKLKLSKRLHKASEFVVPQQAIVDVGSDHAYLPIYLLQQGTIPTAIAGEVAKGPLEHAKEKVADYQLEADISVRLGDGLHVLEESDDLGTIFICGMGGLLIADILNRGLEKDKLPQNSRLVLQPNNAEEDLRKWLVKNHYLIVDEAILEENKKIYEVIVAEHTTKPVDYSAEELFFGPKLIKQQSDTFQKKWNQALNKNKKILKQLTKSENSQRFAEIKENIQKIEKVIT